jgi:sugar transferase (PEP-CTERM system associated)
MVFILGEGILIFCAVGLSSFLLLKSEMDASNLFRGIWLKVLLVSIITQISLYFNDLYEFADRHNLVDLATHLMQSIGLTCILLAVIYFLWPATMIGKGVFFFSLIFTLVFLISWRFLYAIIIRKRLFTEKAIIVGGGELTKVILEQIENRRDISYDIRSLVLHEKERSSPTMFNGIPVRYGFHSIPELSEKEDVSSIIVALDQKRGIMPYNELLRCKTKGISIIDGEDFYERITGKLIAERINPSSLIFSDGFVKSRTVRFTKRLIGLIMSSALLILFSPFMILCAIAIKLDSKGPVLYSQERVGENERIFRLHKFRSMVSDAERETGPVWASDDDPRITRVGRIIRKLRIDELPQVWNVFKGDMSFAGPRPEREFFVEKLKKTVPYYRERFTVKPGVTGWAQIKYPYGATEKDALEKLKYDLYYIKNMSAVMDLVIIFHTVKTTLLGKGAR